MAPTQEARPIALMSAAASRAFFLWVARQRLSVAGAERQVRQKDWGFAFGPWPAAEQQRAKLGQILAFDEELIEGRVALIGRTARP